MRRTNHEAFALERPEGYMAHKVRIPFPNQIAQSCRSQTMVTALSGNGEAVAAEGDADDTTADGFLETGEDGLFVFLLPDKGRGGSGRGAGGSGCSEPPAARLPEAQDGRWKRGWVGCVR